MLSLSVGFAPGPRHWVQVAHVAGPFGVMTTYAVTELGCCLGNDRCCALAAPAVASIAAAIDSAATTGCPIICVPPLYLATHGGLRVGPRHHLGGCVGSCRSRLL